MLMLLFTTVCCLLLVKSTIADSNLKAEYLEKLIDEAFKQKDSYTVRQDNGDFFRNCKKNGVIDYGSFDFIVVGSGSAGSVVASRLSENEKWKILQLEAGGPIDDLTDIPYIWPILQFSDRNWGYYTVPQKNGCFGWKNNQCHYPRGKILGGSSSINGNGCHKGNKEDFNKWAALGNIGWSYDDLLPYFKKMENFESDKADRRYRGFGGPVNIAFEKPKRNLTEVFLAASEVGIQPNEDYNGAHQLGISRQQRFIKFGSRVSGATAYIIPSMTRHNYNVTMEAYVYKIVIDEATKTAKGVLFIKNGQKYMATARKEVILSAGSINSPQLLMLSGIGPKEELTKHSIKVIADHPVGVEARDHYYFRMIIATNYTIQKTTYKELVKQYLNGEGLLTGALNTWSYSYLNTRNKSSSVPNIEVIFHFNNPIPKTSPEYSTYIKEVEDFYNSINDQTHSVMEIFLFHPKSRGSLKLKSKSAKDFPLIDPGFFTHEDDLEVFYEGIQFVNKVLQTGPARKYNMTMVKVPFCGQYEFNSKEYWFCCLKYITNHPGHFTSTVKMGPVTDRTAVVDNRLKVYGIKNLRVADNSILPTHISGHTSTIAMIVGEKAADMIKSEHQ